MIKKLTAMLWILFFSINLHGGQSVSYTFMIADLKYNNEEGIKICELQSGMFSAFRGYDWLVGEPGLVPKKVVEMLTQFSHSLWVNPNAVQETAIRKELSNQKVNLCKNLRELYRNKKFIEEADNPVEDPDDLKSYHVLLITNQTFFKNQLDSFQQDFPNVLILDLPLFAFWRDKYKMSNLFKDHPALEQVKPKWLLFERTISSHEIETSQTQFSSEYVAIKPLSALKGQGVILVERIRLPEILKMIFRSPAKLSSYKDEAYKYWSNAKDKSLIVEEFHFSDPLSVPHLGGKEYDPTLRIAFMLWHEHGEIKMDFIEQHWKLPLKALSEGGTFNEKHKSCAQTPYYALTDYNQEQLIKQQLREIMPLIYARMLETLSSQPDDQR